MKIVLKQKKNCGRARKCLWKIVDEQGRKRHLHTPSVFAGYSVWGNQWLKLLLFYEDWVGKANVLISLFDMFQSGSSRKQTIFDLGFSKGIRRQRNRYIEAISRRLTKRYPGYRDYADYLSDINEGAFDTLMMLDSGGFSLRRPEDFKKIDGLKKLYDQRDHYALQKFILEKQLQTKAEFIITFDRALVPMSIPIQEKQRRQQFSLNCAKAALEIISKKRDRGEEVDALLLAAVHGFGPCLHEINKGKISFEKAGRMYYETTKNYLEELLSFEKDIGITFDGFSVGSLVPFVNNGLIENVAEAVYDVLKEKRALNRLIHGLGATSEWKIRLLTSYGFDLFDTNLHVRMGRYRLYFNPDTREYVKIHDLEKLPCTCEVCTKHSKDHLTETRRGLREVSTVLLSLHNFYSSFQDLIERISRSIEDETFQLETS